MTIGDDEPGVPIAEAAARPGISSEAARKRVQRGTLPGRKVAGAWYVDAVAVPDAPAGRPDAAPDAAGEAGRTRPDAGPRRGGVDLQPLAELIERQGEEIRRLAEASTAWQFRALQAEERLKQLTAGADAAQDAPHDAPEAPGAAAPPDPAFTPSVAAWRERTTRAVDVDDPGAAAWWRRLRDRLAGRG